MTPSWPTGHRISVVTQLVPQTSYQCKRCQSTTSQYWLPRWPTRRRIFTSYRGSVKDIQFQYPGNMDNQHVRVGVVSFKMNLANVNYRYSEYYTLSHRWYWLTVIAPGLGGGRAVPQVTIVDMYPSAVTSIISQLNVKFIAMAAQS